MELKYFDNLKKFLGLSFILAKSEFKTKNTSVYTGIFWQLLNSFLLALMLWLVFSQSLGRSIPDYFAYLLIGISIFNFFQKSTVAAANKFIEWGAVIKSMKFPYQALIFSVMLESLFSHLLEILIMAALFIFVLNISPAGLVFYPPILLLLVLFVYSFCLVLAVLTALLIDVSHFWRFISPLLLFATPIFYSAGDQKMILILDYFNPLYYFITLTREAIIYRQPPLEMVIGALAFSLLTFLVGNILFKKLWYHIVEKF